MATPAAAGELIVDGENGVVSADATPSGFAAALRRLATDAALRAAVTAGAVASAGALDFAGHVDRVDEIYREARCAFGAAH